MTEKPETPIPDFESMTILDLFKWDDEHDYKRELYQKWLNALEQRNPFDTIFERLESVESDLSGLQTKFDRLMKLLEFNGLLETPKVTLKAYVEGKLE